MEGDVGPSRYPGMGVGIEGVVGPSRAHVSPREDDSTGEEAIFTEDLLVGKHGPMMVSVGGRRWMWIECWP